LVVADLLDEGEVKRFAILNAKATSTGSVTKVLSKTTHSIRYAAVTYRPHAKQPRRK